MKNLLIFLLCGLLTAGCSSDPDDSIGGSLENPNGIILFEDPVVRDLCVYMWDTNGDGRLSYAEAAAVKSIDNVFRQNKDIVHFKELKYFTGLKTIEEFAFYKCSSLQSITIPDGVTSIGQDAFSLCSSLTYIRIPKRVTSIGYCAFEDCTSLKSVTIPDGITSIKESTFNGCSSLTNITIPNRVTSIENAAFRSCGLTNITIPDRVTSIGAEAFGLCGSLTSIYCKPTTPPKLGLSVFWETPSDDMKIYVPRTSVDAYKASSYWSVYAIVGYDF